MKMQNAEMEFVTFDAQDVIATSGDPTNLVAPISLLREYNTQYDGFDFGASDNRPVQDSPTGVQSKLNPAYYLGYSYDVTPIRYKLNGFDVESIAASGVSKSGSNGAKGTINNSADTIFATTIADILKWISDNGIGQ